MKRKINRLYLTLLMLAPAILFSTQAGAVIACTSAQLIAAQTDLALKAYCDQQQALIDAQKLKGQALLDALKKKKPASPH
jgi:hypothetical protein